MSGRWGPGMILAGGLAIGILATAITTAQESDKNPYTGDPKAIAEGHQLYLATGCHNCHGLNAEGGTGPDLTDDVWRYQPTDGMLFNTISRGRPGTLMPPWEGKLTPDQIWKIVAYIRSKARGDPSKVLR